MIKSRGDGALETSLDLLGSHAMLIANKVSLGAVEVGVTTISIYIFIKLNIVDLLIIKFLVSE